MTTNLLRPVEQVAAFNNRRKTAEHWIKEGKDAIDWTQLSCRSFAADAVRLPLHARPQPRQLPTHAGDARADQDWSLTRLIEKLIKIGAKLVNGGQYLAFQLVEVAIPRNLFAEILQPIVELRTHPFQRQR